MDSRNLLFIGKYTMFAYEESKKKELRGGKFTFLENQEKLVGSENSEDLAETSEMFLQITALNENIVEIHYNTSPNDRLENLIHQAYKCA